MADLMTVDAGDCRAARSATAALPEKERSAVRREYRGRLALNVDIEPTPETAFEAVPATRSLSGLREIAEAMSAALAQRSNQEEPRH